MLMPCSRSLRRVPLCTGLPISSVLVAAEAVTIFPSSPHFFIISLITNSAIGGKYAVQLTKSDYDKYDYLIGMDSANIRNMKRITGGDEKIVRLLDLTDEPRDVADPWYTGDFDTTYNDVVKGCKVLLEKLEGELNG